MVEYATWVSVVRSTAGAKGANLNDFETNSTVIQVAAEIWRDRKQEIQAASRSKAEEIAGSEVNVS